VQGASQLRPKLPEILAMLAQRPARIPHVLASPETRARRPNAQNNVWRVMPSKRQPANLSATVDNDGT
jgi:hypothetical protein